MRARMMSLLLGAGLTAGHRHQFHQVQFRKTQSIPMASATLLAAAASYAS